jgi:transposase
MSNRCKLGHTLDAIDAYGGDLLFRELALAVCAPEGIDWRCTHLDTTRVSLSGEPVPDSDEQTMTITPGYSTDHRTDVKQAVLELRVSHDGGRPCVSLRGDGHASDTERFQEGAGALIATFQNSPTPRYLVADSKRYNEAHAANLQALGLITRMPHTLTRVSQVITQARPWDTWPQLDDTTRVQRVA